MTAAGRYVGGPLHGQAARRHRGTWPTWREPDGTPVATREGDARYLGPGQRPPFYALADDAGTYVHSGTWAAYRTGRAS